MSSHIPPENKNETNWSGMKTLSKGIICIFAGVALLFVKDHVEIQTLKKIIQATGYVIFLFGFGLGIIGMAKHWKQAFKQ